MITYGTERSEIPSATKKNEAAALLRQTHHIEIDEKIILFNGMLDYKPNLDAVDMILKQLNPLLLNHPGFKYRIIICGKNLPASYNGLSGNENIIYAGFVNDIDVYFLGADIFINPVIEGGGIKTKLAEALGMNLTSVSTVTGAIGIPEKITGSKMIVTRDNNMAEFAEAVIHANTALAISPEFFNHFYWPNIAREAAAALEK